MKYRDGSSYQRDGKTFRIWQIDFQNLRWSVPGGSDIQFGIQAVPRVTAGARQNVSWSEHGSAITGEHSLRVFDRRSLPKSFYAPQAQASAGFNVQAWGHLLANISILPRGPILEVRLRSDKRLQPGNINVKSVLLGTAGKASSSKVEPGSGKDGSSDLVLEFAVSSTGIAPNAVNACVTGETLDGVPFEGCDLMKHGGR